MNLNSQKLNKIKIMSKWHPWLLAVLTIGVSLLSSCGGDNTTSTTSSSENRLEIVKNRGTLYCGINGNIRGFSFPDDRGGYSGMDVDFCRAIAAVLFDDPKKVKFIKISPQERFTKVSKGEVDVLSRNTTWTLNRDTITGMEFGPPLFYDVPGVMTAKTSGIKKLKDLKGKTICVLSGTTAKQNLEDEMSKMGVKGVKIVPSDDVKTLYNNYKEGRCNAIASDRSQLVARRYDLPKPEEHEIIPFKNSIEPLSPAIADGDSIWFDTVKWIAYALIQAEELGINSKNLSSFETSENPKIRRFLGIDENLGEDMGLPNDFAARAIKHVGNYGEIYERNIRQPLKLERGLNNLWTKEGLLYSPPFR